MKKSRTKNRVFIYAGLMMILAVMSACGGEADANSPTPTPTTAVTATVAPTPTPSPTPKKYEADIVDIPDEEIVAAMDIDRIEETPFFTEITNTEAVVLVEFWSENVTYCAEVSETLVALSEDTGVKVVRVNVDRNPTLADGYGLVALPSVYVFLDGEQVNAVLGAAPYADYAAMVEKYRTKE